MFCAYDGKLIEISSQYLVNMPLEKDKPSICYCLVIEQTAQLLKMSIWLRHLFDEDSPPAAGPNTFKCRCHPYAGNAKLSWCMSSSLSRTVGFSIQDETMEVI